MSYTSGTNYRSIKSYSGGRGIVSRMRTKSASAGSNPINKPGNSGNQETGGAGNASSNKVLITQLKTYSKIADNAANGLQENGEKLTAVGENSLFDKAEKSQNNKPVVNEVKDFVNNYNSMMSGIGKLGGIENKQFMSELKKYAETNKEALAGVGITVLKDGSLTMNKKELEGASLESLKKLFNGKDSFAADVTELSEDIEKNVQKKLKENLMILGGSTSTSSNRTKGSSGNFFNMSV